MRCPGSHAGSSCSFIPAPSYSHRRDPIAGSAKNMQRELNRRILQVHDVKTIPQRLGNEGKAFGVKVGGKFFSQRFLAANIAVIEGGGRYPPPLLSNIWPIASGENGVNPAYRSRKELLIRVNHHVPAMGLLSGKFTAAKAISFGPLTPAQMSEINAILRGKA